MFPSVLVWVRQQGAWKLHPYNSIAQNCLLLPFQLKLNKILRTMQLLLTHNLLTHLHSLSHHSGFKHAATLVLTNPYLAYQRTFSSLDRSLTTTGKHTIYFQTLPHHIVHKYSTFKDHPHIEYTFCMDHVLHKFFPIHISTMLFYLCYSSTPQYNQ